MTARVPNVMFVDDDSDIVLVIKSGLKLNGFDVEGFTSSVEALECFKPDYYDFVVTDIKMPKINGFQLYHKIREKDEKVKFYFLTAFDIYEKEAKTIFPNIEANRFMKKPVLYEDLARLLMEDYVQK